MSKIIKAQFVVKTNFISKLNSEDEEKVVHIEQKAIEDKEMLSRNETDNIYQETKAIIEELMSQAQKKADKIILQAKEKAFSIDEQSKLEAERIKNEAYNEGYALGYEAGEKKANLELESKYAQVMSLVESIRLEKEEHIKENKKDIIELIFTLLEKVIDTIVDVKPEIINNLIEKIIEHVQESEKITIKINPIHVPYLDNSIKKIQNSCIDQVKVIEDESLKIGDCLILTETGSVESIIEKQIDLLKDALLEEVTNA